MNEKEALNLDTILSNPHPFKIPELLEKIIISSTIPKFLEFAKTILTDPEIDPIVSQTFKEGIKNLLYSLRKGTYPYPLTNDLIKCRPCNHCKSLIAKHFSFQYCPKKNPKCYYGKRSRINDLLSLIKKNGKYNKKGFLSPYQTTLIAIDIAIMIKDYEFLKDAMNKLMEICPKPFLHDIVNRDITYSYINNTKEFYETMCQYLRTKWVGQPFLVFLLKLDRDQVILKNDYEARRGNIYLKKKPKKIPTDYFVDTIKNLDSFTFETNKCYCYNIKTYRTIKMKGKLRMRPKIRMRMRTKVGKIHDPSKCPYCPKITSELDIYDWLHRLIWAKPFIHDKNVQKGLLKYGNLATCMIKQSEQISNIEYLMMKHKINIKCKDGGLYLYQVRIPYSFPYISYRESSRNNAKKEAENLFKSLKIKV